MLAAGLSGCVTESPAVLPAPAKARAIAGATPVEFPSRDGDLLQGPPTRLEGWLFRPDGPGPFPAIVALHGCGGLYAQDGELTPRHRDWAERLKRLGYVVLFPDSFSPRGLDENCDRTAHARHVHAAIERPRDAYGALQYLQTLPFVRPDAISLLGWSNGGTAVLAAAAAKTEARPVGTGHDFRTAIAFYPDCRPTLEGGDWAPTLPLHILIGALDDWSPPKACADLAGRPFGTPIDLVIYPGAYHEFDDPDLKVQVRHGVSPAGSGEATVGTDPAARDAAIARVAQLLQSVP